MPKTKKTYEKKLYIDMDFAEALERFGTTDPKELPDNIKLSQKRKAADSGAAQTGGDGLKGRGRQPRGAKS